jgi:hypothetical protein
MRTFGRARWGLALAPLVLAACSSGGGGSGAGSTPSADTSLEGANATVQSAMKSYLAAVGGCAAQSNPVVCLEAADHKLGNQIHTYANLLAVGHGFTPPQAEISSTRDAAQTLANSLEILGDAQPTQANYDQVLNTFNVNSAIGQLRSDVTRLGDALARHRQSGTSASSP